MTNKITWGHSFGTPLEYVKSGSLKQAESLWLKQESKGYSLFQTSERPLRPMLAQKFADHKAKVSYPLYAQPKLDGVRAIFHNGLFYSRNGKILTAVSALQKDLPRYHILDGELYRHHWSFNRIISAVKRRQFDTNELEYHIFDIVDSSKRFELRLRSLSHLCLPSRIKVVETVEIASESHLELYLQRSCANGYEGIMLRDKDSFYEIDKRSKGLLKHKPQRHEEEFEITGVAEDSDGGAVWICGFGFQSFRCRPMGSLLERRAMLEFSSKFIGQKLTVRYQELTPDGLPRFPVGILRDYE
jgi:DNA ligase-1